MNNRGKVTGQRLLAVFLMGVALLNYPLLSLVNSSRFVADVPSFYLFLFVVWGGLIALYALVIERRGS